MIFGTIVLILCLSRGYAESTNEESGIPELTYEGDIIRPEMESGGERLKRQAFSDKKVIWKDGVDYTFAPNTPENVKTIFKKAANAWQKNTCIDFRENNNAQAKIGVMKGPGCMSSLGRQGNTQIYMLGDSCMTVGSAIHELGHALGLFHTQARYDRDDYITVNDDNINPDNRGDFKKETKERNENYGIPYDYGSIMHYHAWGFAKDNSKPTMVPKDEKYTRTLGSRVLSFYDLLMINKHYGCLDKCDNKTSAKCANGGFPHPRNCSTCICPSGFGGDLCDARPKGCGKVVRATSTSPRKLNVFVGELRDGEDARECTYWIQAPAGSKVELKIVSMSNWGVVGGCHKGGVEIKTQADPKLTGYRFCASKDVGTTLLSNHSLVPVMAFNHEYSFEAAIEYKVVKS